jgi:hypothetical protein
MTTTTIHVRCRGLAIIDDGDAPTPVALMQIVAGHSTRAERVASKSGCYLCVPSIHQWPLLVPTAIHEIDVRRDGTRLTLVKWKASHAFPAMAEALTARLCFDVPTATARSPLRRQIERLPKQQQPLLALLREHAHEWWPDLVDVLPAASWPWHQPRYADFVVPSFSTAAALTEFMGRWSNMQQAPPMAEAWLKEQPQAHPWLRQARMWEQLATVLALLPTLDVRVPLAYLGLAMFDRAAIPTMPSLYDGTATANALVDAWLQPLVSQRAIGMPTAFARHRGFLTADAWAAYLARAMDHAIEQWRAVHASTARTPYRFLVQELNDACFEALDLGRKQDADHVHAALAPLGYDVGPLNIWDQSFHVRRRRHPVVDGVDDAMRAISVAWSALPAVRETISLDVVHCFEEAFQTAPADRVAEFLQRYPMTGVAVHVMQDARILSAGDVLARDNASAPLRFETHGNAATDAPPNEVAYFVHVLVVNYHHVTSAERANALFHAVFVRRKTLGLLNTDGSITFMGCAALALAPFWRPALSSSARHDTDLQAPMSIGVELCVRRALEALFAKGTLRYAAEPAARPPPAWRKAPRGPVAAAPAPAPVRDTTDRFTYPRFAVRNATDLVVLPAKIGPRLPMATSRQQMLGIIYRLLTRPNAPPVTTHTKEQAIFIKFFIESLNSNRVPATSHWLDSD